MPFSDPQTNQIITPSVQFVTTKLKHELSWWHINS